MKLRCSLQSMTCGWKHVFFFFNTEKKCAFQFMVYLIKYSSQSPPLPTPQRSPSGWGHCCKSISVTAGGCWFNIGGGNWFLPPVWGHSSSSVRVQLPQGKTSDHGSHGWNISNCRNKIQFSGIGRVGGRLKREGIWGYMYTYSWFTLLYSRN